MNPKSLIGVDLDAVPTPESLAAQLSQEKPSYKKLQQVIWRGIEIWVPSNWALSRAGGGFQQGVLRFAQIKTPKDLKETKIEMVIAGADLNWGPIPEESALRSLTKMGREHRKKLKREYRRSLKTYEDFYVEINEHPTQFLNLEYIDKTKIGRLKKIFIEYESVDILFPCHKTKRGFVLAYFARADLFPNMERKFLKNLKTLNCHRSRDRDYWKGFGWQLNVPEMFFIESGKCTDESGVLTFRAGERKEQRRIVVSWLSKSRAKASLDFSGDTKDLIKRQLEEIKENLDKKSSMKINSEAPFEMGEHEAFIVDYQLTKKETLTITRIRSKLIAFYCNLQERVYFISIGAPIHKYEEIVNPLVEKIAEMLKCHIHEDDRS